MIRAAAIWRAVSRSPAPSRNARSAGLSSSSWLPPPLAPVACQAHHRQLHAPRAKDSSQGEGLKRVAGASARGGESASGGAQQSQRLSREKRRAAQRGVAMSAICQALRCELTRGAPGASDGSGDDHDARAASRRRASSLDAALRPWAEAIDKYVVTDVLKAHRKDPPAALAFYRWAQTQPWYRALAPDLHAYNILIGIYGRAGDLAQVDALLREVRRAGGEPNAVMNTQLLSAYGRAHRWAEVDDIRGRLQAQGQAMDIFLCSTLVDVYANAGAYSKAIDACRAFVATGGEPNTKLYSRLIWLHGRCGAAREALEVLGRMKAAGCAPDLFTYNTLLDACGKAGRVRAALALFGEMGRRGMRPDAVTYNTLVDACGRNGMCGEAVRFFGEMERAGIAPGVASFTSLVSMWGAAGRPDKAREWFDKMEGAGCRPNVLSYNSLLQAYLKSGALWEARRALLELKNSHGASLDTYRMLLHAHMQCTSEEGWGDIWRLMELSGHHMHGRLKLLFQREQECTRGPRGEQQLREDLDAVLSSVRSEDSDLQKGFVNALVGFLWDVGRREHAFAVWALARSKGLHPLNVTVSASGVLALNFHGTYWNTALVALLCELAALRARALDGGEPFATSVELITGRGARSQVKGKSSVKHAVKRMCAAMGLPFFEDFRNTGRLKARGGRLKQWLVRPEAEEALSSRSAEAFEGCEPPPAETD
eukprot:jgi/Mesen1/8118/ME000436S07360